MGYPSDKALQSLIRNRIESVAKFLNERHEDSYRIFNLCKESDYDISFFGNRVVHVPLEDHNPPTFSQIINFCDQMDEWLKESPQNMAVIHCKAGKVINELIFKIKNDLMMTIIGSNWNYDMQLFSSHKTVRFTV